MKVKLKKGFQTKLIFLAKKDLTWTELAKAVETSPNYLCNDLKYENTLISENLYRKLCQLANISFDENILEKLPDNWGKSMGGKNSKGNLKEIQVPKKDEKLAEFIGALLGDGNINYYKKGSKVGVYQIKIAGDLKLDKDYHINYLRPLAESMFKLKVNEILHTKNNERFLVIYSKRLVEFFSKMGLMPGDKIKNQITLPHWIYSNKEYLKCCIRGLMDTDGSIFRMSKRDFNLLRVGFTNYNLTLILDVKKALESLGFSVSLNKNKKQIYISRKAEVERYLKEIGFSNPKHLHRLEVFQSSK